MTNKKLLLILIFLSIRGIGQKKDYIPVETPVSPEAYSFSKVSNSDIDFIHGKANITIPLYEINDKGIKIPIALSYNSGGIKLNEVSSSVGLGWTLSLSNNIGKEIRDKEDDYFPNKWIPTSDEMNQLNNGGIVIKNNLGNILYETPILQKVFRSIGCSDYDPDFDTASDIYSYSTPTASGSFIIDSSGAIHTIPNNNDKIQATSTGFLITDTQATKYYFSRTNLTFSGAQDYFGYTAGDDIPSTGSYSNYRLDSIQTIYNNQVQYKYLRQNIVKTKNKVEQISILVKRPPSNSLHGQAVQDKYKSYNMVTSSNESLITEIVFSQGRVLFIYSDENNKINNYGYRLDLQEKDTPFNNNSPAALKEIKVLNKADKVVKHYVFNYDYFVSLQATESPEKYRLKLVSLEDKLSGNFHYFDYYEDFNMPSRDSNSRDYWGYYNGENNTTTIPKYSSSMYINNAPFYYPQGADLKANEIYAKTYSLKAITFPTGAKQKFSYEGNKVYGKSPFVSLVTGNTDTLVAENNSVYTTSEKNIILPEQIKAELDPISGEGFKLNFQTNQSPEQNQQVGTFCIGSLINLDENNNRTIVLPSITTNSTIDLLLFKNSFKTNKFIFKIEQEGNCSCSMKIDYSYYNKYNEDTEFLVGGNRISEIELIDGQNSYKTKYKYNYVDENTNTLTNKSSGYLYVKNSTLKKYINQEKDIYGNDIEDNKSVRYIVYNNPLSGMSSSFQSVKYKNVRLITEGKGFIDYKFNLPDNVENFMINDYFSIMDEGKFNLIKEKKVYDENNHPLNRTFYSYEFDETKNNLSSNKRLNYIYFNINLSTYLDRIVSSSLSTEYRYKINYELINYENSFHKSTHEENVEYPKGILDYRISKITTREYNTSNINNPFVLSKETVTYPDKIYDTKFTYPFELNLNQLKSLNYISPVINENSLNNNMISKVVTEYNNLSIFPTGIKTYSLSGNISSLEATFDKYDDKGNILQYTEKTIKPVAIIWGYNQTQPIAKIEGAKYDDVKTLQVVLDAIAASNADALDPTKESDLIAALDKLRDESTLKGYQISTYTYDPLIGVTSITPVNGVREIYQYDSANRLEKVIDINGNILKENKYHYKQ